jgi:hypothetical protein
VAEEEEAEQQQQQQQQQEVSEVWTGRPRPGAHLFLFPGFGCLFSRSVLPRRWLVVAGPLLLAPLAFPGCAGPSASADLRSPGSEARAFRSPRLIPACSSGASATIFGMASCVLEEVGNLSSDAVFSSSLSSCYVGLEHLRGSQDFFSLLPMREIGRSCNRFVPNFFGLFVWFARSPYQRLRYLRLLPSMLRVFLK